MKIEIYVQNPNSKRWEVLDLFKDESVNVNFKLKDLNDISKVFSTYSQDFSAPASSRNNKVYNYFFNTEISRVRDRGLPAKLYVNDSLFRVGQIIINEGSVSNYKLSSYKVQFRTVIAQLKEKIGDDTLSSAIGDELNRSHSIPWSSQDVYDRIAWSDGSEDVQIPLISTNRVWSYGDGTSSDISKPANGISKFELRPAIRLGVLLDLIIQKYDLNVDFPIKTSEEFDKLYVWLNNNVDNDEQPPVTYKYVNTQPWILDTTSINNSKKFFDVVNNSGGIQILDTGVDYSPRRFYSIAHTLEGITNFEDGNAYKGKLTMIVRERGTGVTTTYSLDIDGSAVIFHRVMQGKAGTSKILDISLTFDKPVEVNNFKTRIQTLDPLTIGEPLNRMISSNNILPPQFNDFDIKYALGGWKVIDLISSIFKMFNIRVVEDYNANSMRWLTPIEYYRSGKLLDFNNYTNVKGFTIKPSKNYKSITLKHSNENYLRNDEYRKLVDKDYGSEVFTSADTSLTDSYTVETKFSIMNWFLLNKTSLKTSYGFNKPGSPNEPSSPTIMYNQGFEVIRMDDDTSNIDARFKIPQSGNTGYTNQLSRYVKFGNQSSDDFENYRTSLTFDIDIEPSGSVPMLKSLYSNYYSYDIERLYLPNSNYYEFEGYLSNNRVLNFNMSDRLIIEDSQYTIEDATIDITTGKFKMILLNQLAVKSDTNYPTPMEPLLFTANGGIGKITGSVNTGDATTAEISHYHIQYKLQGSNVWNNALNLTYVPYESISWTINSLQAGIYDLRCRTVAPSPNPNTSDWVYANNITVKSKVVTPIGVIIDTDVDRVRTPCTKYPAVLSNDLKFNQEVWIPTNDLSEITSGTQLYKDKDLTILFKPSSEFKYQITTLDAATTLDADISLNGKIDTINPCKREPLKMFVSTTSFETPNSLDKKTWLSTNKTLVYFDKPFNIGAKAFEDSDLSIPSKVVGRFEDRYTMISYDEEGSDVRFVKINNGSISEAPLPVINN